MAEPRLLVINGTPASGKSTLAPRLCARLRLPLIAKDTIKEALGDALGTRSLEESLLLGRASYPVLYAIARAQLDLGVSVAVEAPFSAPASNRDLKRLTSGVRAAMILCQASPAVLRERSVTRAAGRHPVHREPDRLLGPRTGAPTAPLRLPEVEMPVLRVDTDHGYDPPLEELVRWVRTVLELPG